MDRRKTVRARTWAALIVLGVLSGFAAGQVEAQIWGWGRARVQDESAIDAPPPSTFPAPDRATLQQFARSKEALTQGRFGEALEGFADILKTPEDYFFQPDKKQPVYRSLKAEARRLIGAMPAEGRQLYEAKAGGEAREMLRKAVADGDATRLAEVAGRYFHTQAGYEATFLLGLYHLDHGAPLAAALTLKRLREVSDASGRFEPALSLATAACWQQAGMADNARRVLVELKRARPELGARIGGREVKWFDDDGDSLSWLAQLTGPPPAAAAVDDDRWVMHRGDPARNAATRGSAPLLNMLWHVRASENDAILKSLQQKSQSYRDRGISIVSGLHPLVVDDVVMMRTAKNLVAVDFATGKLSWEVSSEEAAETAQPSNMGLPREATSLALYAQRMWNDATYGTLASDGRLVFSIEDLALAGNNENMGGQVMFVNGRRIEQINHGTSNRLAAIEVRSGRLKWERGGQNSERQSDPFYLGPPLPYRGQLFIIAESRDEIRLLALDAATGNQLWAQQLAMVEHNIQQDPYRRLAGVSPSYSDGILICPTGAGSVVAVDLATRALLWGVHYGPTPASSDSARQQQQRIMMMQGGMYPGLDPVPRWIDGSATVADGRVILTPAESDGLYCLNLIDGTPAWPAQPRGDNLYVACVYKGKIVLVGTHEIRALHLASGRPAWDGHVLKLPTGVTVTGRGYVAGDRYYLPMSSAEVMVIDLENGAKVLTAKSRKGVVPGNMVCYRGKVLSQGFDGLDTFYQADAARDEIRRRLAANANDAEAISLRGELLMDEGKQAEAIADFRRAFELNRNDDSHLRTQELLRDALLDGLQIDFAANRRHAEEIERLLETPTQWATYLRLMAVGMQKAGEWHAALDNYLKLVDLEPGKRPLETVERSHLVRRDRWVQAQLADLRRAAGAEAAAEVDRVLAARLKTIKAGKDEKDLDALRRFVDYFGNQPAGDEARQDLLRRLTAAEQFLEAELLLTNHRVPAAPRAAATVLFDMATMYDRGKRPEMAAACYRQLAAQYGDATDRDGKTARQLLAALPADSPLRRAVDAPPPAWPLGEVEIKRGGSSDFRGNPYGRFGVPFSGSAAPFFVDTTLRFDQNQQTVVGYDSTGHKKWEIQLTEGGRRSTFNYNSNMIQARTEGHLLFVAMGSMIFALDPAGVAGKSAGSSGKVVWSQNLSDQNADIDDVNQQIMMQRAFLFQQAEFAFRPNPFGPVNSHIVSFLRFRNLVAVDPLTGETLWVRQDLPQNSEVFGDDQYVFVVSPGQTEASVYRALDGELVGKRKIPRVRFGGNSNVENLETSVTSRLATTGMTTIGRYVLTLGPAATGNRRELACYDPWEGRAVWPTRTFGQIAIAAMVGEEAVGVFEPDGHFVLISLPDGRTIADTKLDLGKDDMLFSEIIVTRLGDQYFVLTHDARQRGNRNGNGMNMMQPLPGTLYHQIRRAKLYALDLSGKPLWKEPVDVEDQYLLLSQPARLPVLAFAGHRYIQNKGGQLTQKTAVLVIDRRTGRVIYDKETVNPTMTLDLVGDAAQKSVDMLFQNSTVTFNFTDKPLPPLVPGQRGRQSRGNITDALMKALQRSATDE